jgi:hypothetical protein
MELPRMNAVLILHAAVTFYMVGVIWFVQLVHYPLFHRVGEDGFIAYERSHMQRTGWVVAGPMLMELLLAGMIVWQSAGILSWVGMVLVLFIWLTTGVFQVPAHRRLASGFDSRTYRRLVNTNWLRTVAWSARGIIAVLLLADLA